MLTHTHPSGHVNTVMWAQKPIQTLECTHHYAHIQYVNTCKFTPHTHYRLKGPTSSLIMVWLPPLVHISTNTHTHTHTCTHRCLCCAKWKLCVRASSRTAQLPAMPATLSRPNGLSEQQHCIWRVVHSRAFCGSSGTFCLSGYACQSVWEPAGTGWWRGTVCTTRNRTLFAKVRMTLIHRWKFCICFTLPLHFKEKWRITQWFNKINIHCGQVSENCGTEQGSSMCTKLMLVRNICVKELFPEENKCVSVRSKY